MFCHAAFAVSKSNCQTNVLTQLLVWVVWERGNVLRELSSRWSIHRNIKTKFCWRTEMFVVFFCSKFTSDSFSFSTSATETWVPVNTWWKPSNTTWSDENWNLWNYISRALRRFFEFVKVNELDPSKEESRQSLYYFHTVNVHRWNKCGEEITFPKENQRIHDTSRNDQIGN